MIRTLASCKGKLTMSMPNSKVQVSSLRHGQHSIPHLTLRSLLAAVDIGDVVCCGMGVVTWFTALTNQMHSARSVPHFTFRIPQFRILPVRNVLGRSHMSSYIHLQINIIIPSFAFFLRAKVPPIFSRNDSSFFSFFDVDGVEAIFLICVITEKYRKVSNAKRKLLK